MNKYIHIYILSAFACDQTCGYEKVSVEDMFANAI